MQNKRWKREAKRILGRSMVPGCRPNHPLSIRKLEELCKGDK